MHGVGEVLFELNSKHGSRVSVTDGRSRPQLVFLPLIYENSSGGG